MMKNFLKPACVASGLMLGATVAQAASVESVQLTFNSTGGITAIAEDGQTYSKLESTELMFHGSLHLAMDTGKVEGFKIYNGACAGLCPNGIGYSALFFYSVGQTDNIDKDFSFGVSADDYPQGLSQNLEAGKIFKACSERMQNSIVQNDVTFLHLMKVTLSLDFAESGEALGSYSHDWWKAFPVPVRVTCKPLDQQHAPGGIAQDMGEFKTTDIDLFLSTFAGATTSPNPATVCKKGRVLVRAKTSKAGPAKFKLWTKVGNAPMTSKVVDAWSSHDGNGGFEAEHIEWVSVDETTQIQAMAEDMVNGVGQSTNWKNLTLHCSNKEGGGGFTVGVDQPQLPERKLTGDFSFIDHGSPRCSRTGKVIISFKSNRADDVHYKLDCTNGQSFSGVAKMANAQDGGLVGAAMQGFTIDKTSVYSCALKTVQPGPAKLHEWKSHKFGCVIPSVETGSNDLQVAPKATGAEDRKNRLEAAQQAREAANKKAKAERRRKALIAAEKAKQDRKLAEKRRREMLKKRLKAAKEKNKKKAQRKVRRKHTAMTESNSHLQVLRLR